MGKETFYRDGLKNLCNSYTRAVVIGKSNYFGFDFRCSIENHSVINTIM